MNKYIKVKDIKNALIELVESGKRLERKTTTNIIKALNNLQTIDIVHCKECIHCLDEVIEDTIPIYIYCDLWKGETEWDGFCSYGEREGE